MVKTTISRLTLHLVAGADYPAYAQLTRQTRMRKWRKDYAHLDEARVAGELGDWLRTPRSNVEIRERVRRYEGVPPTRPTRRSSSPGRCCRSCSSRRAGTGTTAAGRAS